MASSSASISIRFVEGTAWDSRVIRWQTRCWMSHVEAMVGPQLALGAMLRGGVSERSTAASCYSGISRRETWLIPASKSRSEAFHKFLYSQLGQPYDWRAIMSFGLGERDWREPGAWFCSELQGAALETAGVIELPTDLPVCRLTPRDIYMLVTQLNGARRAS